MIDFLYPKFKEPTHMILSDVGISTKYPDKESYKTSKDVDVKSSSTSQDGNGDKAVLIRENVGYNCEWSYVEINGKNSENAGERFFILSSNLKNIGYKKSYNPACNAFSQIDETAEEINPYFKQVFVPYIDRKNGLFSVRVSIDQDRITDMKLFDRVLEQVYYEGVAILLSSKGLRSNNESIRELKDQYYSFAYINKDLDLTTRRPCEPLTFTVSIPLNFFDEAQAVNEPEPLNATKFIEFDNNSFVDKIDSLLTILYNKSKNIKDLLYPNKILENFIIDFELNSLRGFSVATNELMTIANSPIGQDSNTLTNYKIGLDDDLNIVSVDINKINRQTGQQVESIKFAQGLLAQARLQGEFNNKRIFNYLLNLEVMENESQTTDTLKYIQKFVKYPDVNLIDETVELGGITFPAETVSQFRMSFEKDKEACVNISDIQNLAVEGIRTVELANPLYHFFIPNDPANGLSINSLSDQMKQAAASIRKNINDTQKSGFFDDVKELWDGTVNVGTSNIIWNNIKNDAATQFSLGKGSFRTNLNTLSYILRRIDIEEVLFRKILCLLKGTDPNSPETAALLAQIPFEIINYIRYLQGIQGLRGAAYQRALIQGISFDYELFCNDEVAYLIKGLTKFLQTTNIIMEKSLLFLTEIDNTLKAFEIGGRRTNNPYQAIVDSVSKIAINLTKEFLFEYIRDTLTEECDEAILDGDIDNFADPFGTHVPVDGYNNSKNNDPNIIKNNRKNALTKTLPDIVRTITFGSDLDYTVDLIGSLIRDINCILTLSESISLLEGTPSDEVVILVKNIIRSKYSKDPNNLSYLLNDDLLKEFFRKLGYTVDQQLLSKLSDPIEEFKKIKDADVCTPAQYEIRRQILENKLPKELGVLADDTARRTARARELIEKIKGGTVTYNISALCPDIEDSELDKTKDFILEQYKDSVRSMFSQTLNTFTVEASSAPNKFAEERAFTRKNSDTTDAISYFTYNSNLYDNMFYGKILNNISTEENVYENFPGLSVNPGVDDYTILYKIKNKLPIDFNDLADKLLFNEAPETSAIDECNEPGAVSDINDLFVNALKEGRIIYESRDYDNINATAVTALTVLGAGIGGAILAAGQAASGIYQRDWDSISENYATRNTNSNAKEDTAFKEELVQTNPALFKYIKDKRYVIFISKDTVEQEIKKIWFRLVYYDPKGGTNTEYPGDFILVKQIKFSNDVDDNGDQSSDEELSVSNISYELDHYSGFDVVRATDEGRDIIGPDGEIRNYLEEEIQPDGSVVSWGYSFNNVRYDYLKIFYDGRDYRADARVFGKNFLNYSNVEDPENLDKKLSFNVVQENVVKLLEKVESLKTYESLINTFEKFDANGLFNIETNIKTGVVSVNVAYTANSEELGEKLSYKTIYNINVPKQIFSSLDQELTGRQDKTYGSDISIYSNFGLVSLYNICSNKLSSSYFKNQIDIQELQFIKDSEEPKIATFVGEFIEYSTDSAYRTSKNPSYVDNIQKNHINLNLLDYNNNIKYKNCNLFPHYLNLEYFLNLIQDEQKRKLCDTNLNKIPLNILDYILVRLTIRTHITDQLSKCVPFLSLMDTEDLKNLHKEQYVVDMMREHMRNEMNMFSSTSIAGNIFEQNTEKQYYNAFVNKKVKKVYKESYEEPLSINRVDPRFVDENSQNKEINYYIKKEIYHFIAFALDNKIIVPNDKSIYKNYEQIIRGIRNITSGLTEIIRLEIFEVLSRVYVSSDENGENKFSNLLKNDFYTMMIYFLMANTVDSVKRNIFAGTKAELAKLFFSNVNNLDSDTTEEEKYNEKADEDIVKFISKIGYTNNPAALAVLNPDYSKYISYFIEASLEETKSILLNNAIYTDKNILLTRLINNGLSFASAVSWSLIDAPDRQKLIADAAVNNRVLGLFYKRLDGGLSPTPDILISAALSFTKVGSPASLGVAYLLLDTYKEAKWGINTWAELTKLAESIRSQLGVDKCAKIEDSTPAIACNPNLRPGLLSEVNKYEEYSEEL